MCWPMPTRSIDSAEGLHVIRMPEHYGALSPILHVVPLQLLAYHTAVARGHGCGQAPQPGQERDGSNNRRALGARGAAPQAQG